MSTPPPPPPPGYPPQPPGYPPQPPGYPQYGYGGQPQSREYPGGTTILVLGILSLVVGFMCGLGFILGPFAWGMGNKAIRAIDATPGSYSNRGSVQAGRICGIVSTVFLVLGVAFVLLIIVIAAASGGSSG